MDQPTYPSEQDQGHKQEKHEHTTTDLMLIAQDVLNALSKQCPHLTVGDLILVGQCVVTLTQIRFAQTVEKHIKNAALIDQALFNADPDFMGKA